MCQFVTFGLLKLMFVSRMKVGCVGGAGGGTFQGQASDDREQFSSLSRSESDKKPILLSLGYDARSDFG